MAGLALTAFLDTSGIFGNSGNMILASSPDKMQYSVWLPVVVSGSNVWGCLVDCPQF
jgi:hypothetical protein